MATDELYGALQVAILKMAISESKKERLELRKETQRIIKELKCNHAGALKLSDDVVKKLFELIKDNKRLKRELDFIQIAAGSTLFSELKNTVYCIKEGIKYVEKNWKGYIDE